MRAPSGLAQWRACPLTPRHSSFFNSSSFSFFQAGHRLHCCLGTGPWKCPLAHSPRWQLLIGGEVQIISLLGSPRALQNLLFPYVATFSSTIFRGIPIGNRLKKSWSSVLSGSWQARVLCSAPTIVVPGGLKAQGQHKHYKQQLVLLAITEPAGLTGPSHKWLIICSSHAAEVLLLPCSLSS